NSFPASVVHPEESQMNRPSAALLFPLVLCLAGFALSPPAPRTVDLKSGDGTPLKGTYFPAGRPGPGVILYHQANRTRESWSGVASPLSPAGMTVLTVDIPGPGPTGGARRY